MPTPAEISLADLVYSGTSTEILLLGMKIISEQNPNCFVNAVQQAAASKTSVDNSTPSTPSPPVVRKLQSAESGKAAKRARTCISIHSMDSSTSEAMATPAPIEVRDEVEEDEVVVPCKNNVSEEAEESDLTDDAPSDDESSYLLPVLKTRNRRKKGEGTGLRKTHPQNTTKLYEAFTEPSKRRADRMLVHDLEYKGEAGPKSLLSAFCRWVEARERQQSQAGLIDAASRYQNANAVSNFLRVHLHGLAIRHPALARWKDMSKEGTLTIHPTASTSSSSRFRISTSSSSRIPTPASTSNQGLFGKASSPGIPPPPGRSVQSTSIVTFTKQFGRKWSSIVEELNARTTIERRQDYVRTLEEECLEIIDPIIHACALPSRSEIAGHDSPKVASDQVSIQTVFNGLHNLLDLALVLALATPASVAAALNGEVALRLYKTLQQLIRQLNRYDDAEVRLYLPSIREKVEKWRIDAPASGADKLARSLERFMLE